MGNMIFVTRPPETSTLSVAPIRTPFTDMTAIVGHHDGNMRCFPFQLRWIDCCEAYGREMAKVKCKYLFQDFIECAKGWKQARRCSDMLERHYQLWFQGVRGVGPKRELYFETPRYDSYAPNFQIEDVNWKAA